MEQRPFFIVEETAAKRETWEGSKQKCRRKILRESRRVGGEEEEEEETAAKRETWEGSKQKCRRKILRESRRVGGEGKEKEETAAKTKDMGW